jgi:hypothetical protein
MTTANRYSGYSANFTYGSSQTLALRQMRSIDLQGAHQFNEVIPAGAVDRQAVVLRSSSAIARLSTQDLLTALGTISPTVGLACNGLCTFQYQKRQDSGVFAGGSNNIKAVAQTGFLLADSISASGDNPASLDMTFYSLWDGTNDPWAFTDGVALTGGAPTYLSDYYLGPVYLGASQIFGLTGTKVDFGIKFAPFLADGDLFPRSGAIMSRRPTVSLTMSKVDWITGQMNSMFNNALGSTLAVYFAQGNPGGGRGAYASSIHAKISVATGALNSKSVTVRDEDDATITIDIIPTGTISLSVASTIP